MYLFWQVLITPDSVRVHREVLKHMPVLRRLTKSKLNEEQARTMSDILDSLTKYKYILLLLITTIPTTSVAFILNINSPVCYSKFYLLIYFWTIIHYFSGYNIFVYESHKSLFWFQNLSRCVWWEWASPHEPEYTDQPWYERMQMDPQNINYNVLEFKSIILLLHNLSCIKHRNKI